MFDFAFLKKIVTFYVLLLHGNCENLEKLLRRFLEFALIIVIAKPQEGVLEGYFKSQVFKNKLEKVFSSRSVNAKH